ncbi:MAG: hypothetical protein KDB39_19505, partial [Austwickia sp.]|nr:hypothetical protein [Austwickia sp.]
LSQARYRVASSGLGRRPSSSFADAGGPGAQGGSGGGQGQVLRAAGGSEIGVVRAWVTEQIGLVDAAVVAAGRGADLAGWLRQVAGPGARDRIVALENPRLPQRL